MPELPEVETIKRDLEKAVTGLRIDNVEVFDVRVIKDLSSRQFIQKLRGRTIANVARRGKAVILTFDNNTCLVIQVKMTGHLIYGPHLRKDDVLRDTKAVFTLSDGKFLNYNDQRLFGWLIFTDSLERVSYLNTIGPEPLECNFSAAWLRAELRKRKSPIKPLLMNQFFLAGIGNIYASEILYSAGVRPTRRANRLKIKEIDSLHSSTVSILREAIKCRGTSLRNYRDSAGEKGRFMNRIQVYGRETKECFRCRRPIKRIVQAGRSTFYCEQCQK